MIKHNKAYKFRLYPTEEQAHLIRNTFGCVRFVYNKMLAERKEVETVVGLDFAMAELYVSSEDEKANYPRFYRQMLDRLAKAQRVLARRIKDSARWKK
ncbi:hypothetical protein ATN06_16450 [Bacillus thuringiensis]|nr:hypothetical protein ATN06_16450 [Bacillus thuringiensis]